MPWCVPGRAFVLGTALNKLHPVTLTPSELCDRALPRPLVTRGWGLSASHLASIFYSLVGGGGSRGTPTYMTQNDPPRCADHFEGCIKGEIFLEKQSSRPLCGAIGESSLEVVDQPLGTGLSREPLSQITPPPLGGSNDPPPPRAQHNFHHA